MPQNINAQSKARSRLIRAGRSFGARCRQRFDWLSSSDSQRRHTWFITTSIGRPPWYTHHHFADVLKRRPPYVRNRVTQFSNVFAAVFYWDAVRRRGAAFSRMYAILRLKPCSIGEPPYSQCFYVAFLIAVCRHSNWIQHREVDGFAT